MRVRSLGFRTDLMVRRLAGSEVSDCGDHLVIRTPLAPTFYWGNFLLLAGSCVVADAERWIQEFSHQFPGAAHVAIGWDRTTDRARGSLEPLQQMGLELQPDLVMTAVDVVAPHPLSLPVECRRLTTGSDWMGLEALEAEVWGVGPGISAAHRDFLSARVAESRRLAETGRAAYFGAFLEGRLVSATGMVVQRRVGRFQNVNTAPEHRRLGLASALLELAGRFAREQLGAARLVIVADPAGPAAALYRSLGFVETECQLGLQREAA
ncbi:MAG: GNAT family N-acetyltransferase [Candidatus Dormibacteria bacterium]